MDKDISKDLDHIFQDNMEDVCITEDSMLASKDDVLLSLDELEEVSGGGFDDWYGRISKYDSWALIHFTPELAVRIYYGCNNFSGKSILAQNSKNSVIDREGYFALERDFSMFVMRDHTYSMIFSQYENIGEILVNGLKSMGYQVQIKF